MKKTSVILMLFMVFTLAFAGCGKAENSDKNAAPAAPTDKAVDVNISAAASLTEALGEIQQEYKKESNANLQFNFGASGSLQQQIQEGAPCDLFISASKANMDTLEDGGLIVADSRKDLLGNKLTLIAAAEKADTIKGYDALTTDKVTSIAVGTPETVPAGKYAKQSLEKLGVWDQIQSKIVYGKDVKGVLEYVDTGNADCGFVYKTDALLMKSGVVVMDMPEDSHDPIVYPAALIKDSAQQDAASKFYDFLKSDFSRGVFEKYGFTVL
ncbi:MAG TPA: molybdate ABC transporter substrate-binding protein [Bacillota bacterium]|nr:molybdate ABC transporter substrate-binding protein [Bacillota bacterium]